MGLVKVPASWPRHPRLSQKKKKKNLYTQVRPKELHDFKNILPYEVLGL